MDGNWSADYETDTLPSSAVERQLENRRESLNQLGRDGHADLAHQILEPPESSRFGTSSFGYATVDDAIVRQVVPREAPDVGRGPRALLPARRSIQVWTTTGYKVAQRNEIGLPAGVRRGSRDARPPASRSASAADQFVASPSR